MDVLLLHQLLSMVRLWLTLVQQQQKQQKQMWAALVAAHCSCARCTSPPGCCKPLLGQAAASGATDPHPAAAAAAVGTLHFGLDLRLRL